MRSRDWNIANIWSELWPRVRALHWWHPQSLGTIYHLQGLLWFRLNYIPRYQSKIRSFNMNPHPDLCVWPCLVSQSISWQEAMDYLVLCLMGPTKAAQLLLERCLPRGLHGGLLVTAHTTWMCALPSAKGRIRAWFIPLRTLMKLSL